VGDEYIGRHCRSIQIVDPFSGNNVELGERAETPLKVESADYPKVFKSAKDAKTKSYEEFLLNAEGEYSDEEDKAVKAHFQES